ncbi:MAG: YaeQ family protein [Myxococcales bacterium]|nr:YaeQ family protein [Myxococcales bacterium]
MALTATMYRWQVNVSDVDRGVYTTLDLRLAQHPSESLRYLVTRALAYCLSYEDGIAFSKGGISSTDEPPVSVHDPTGLLTAWIDVGAPTAERLHKAAKAAPKVVLFTSSDLVALRREATGIHRVEAVEVLRIEQRLIDEIAERVERNLSLELTRSDAHLYVTVAGQTLSGSIEPQSLVER